MNDFDFWQSLSDDDLAEMQMAEDDYEQFLNEHDEFDENVLPFD